MVGRDYVIPAVTEGKDVNVETGFVFASPPRLTIDRNKDYRAVIRTNLGNFTVDLFENNAPRMVNSFVFLADRGYYNGTYFHRMVPDLFIHGGDRNTLNDDPSDDGFGGPGYLLNDEINWNDYGFSQEKQDSLSALGYASNSTVRSIKLKKFSVAAASTLPNAIGSQFFIVTAEDDDPRLTDMAGKYTVFGEVILGKDTVSRLAAIEVDAKDALIPRPVMKLTINSIDIIN